MKTRLLMTALLCQLSMSNANAAVADFEDLALAPESWFAPEMATSFNSGGASFQHDFTNYGGGCCWSGYTYSNTTDTTTVGVGNQYSAITGSGVNNSGNYGISNPGFNPSRIDFSSATSVDGAWFTNTSYAYLSMLNGDTFAKKFESGDYFTLTVTGLDEFDSVTGAVDIALADGANLLDQWYWQDLGALGTVHALTFSLDSSDIGMYGMNTPAYFAIDDLTFSAAVPVPAAFWLFGSGLISVLFAARKRR